MTNDTDLFQAYTRLINPAYPQFLKRLGLEHAAVRAEGAWITDSSGQSYLDCVSGYGLYALGHNHPRLIQALKQQLDRNQLGTRPLITSEQVDLARKLQDICPGDLECSFLTNSGSEAVDTALKLARLHTGKTKIVCAQKSFHGYTFGALSASGFPAFKRHFLPLVPEIVHVPFGDTAALAQAVDPDTAAVLLEPLQHEGGVHVPDASYLADAGRLCADSGAVFILDEIKTGLGKTGAWFACQKRKAVPDLLLLGKALGGGLMPAGAVVARRKIWKKFGLSFPMSASSYAGNSLTCRVAAEVLETLEDENLIEDAGPKGRRLLSGLQAAAAGHEGVIKSVQGSGLLIAVEMAKPGLALALVQEMISRGVLVLPAFGNPAAVMIEPPLVISYQEIERILDVVDLCIGGLDKTFLSTNHTN